MKKLLEILKANGIEIPEEKQADVKKAFFESYKSVGEYNKAVTKLTEARDALQTRVENAETTLKAFEGMDAEKVKAELAEWKKKAEDAEKNFNAQITARDQKDWLKAKLEEYGVTSPYARKQLMAECMDEKSGLKWKGAETGFYGFDDFMTVPLDQDDEIVEEIEEKDIRLYGVDGMLERRAANHVRRMAAKLDRAFFTAAYNGATEAEINSNDPIEDQLEAIIQTCENTMNDFVDGVPRAMMRLVCGTYVYGKIRNALDKAARTNVDTTTEEFYAWHGVEVKSCVHLPAGCPFLLIVEGSVAQPVYAKPYTAEKIPLADAYAVELFYHYGTTVITPDLIFKPKYVTAASGDSASGSDDSGSGSGTATANAKLSALTIGNLTLSPTFDADTTAYTVATTNATNTVTATAADSNATITITNGSTQCH